MDQHAGKNLCMDSPVSEGGFIQKLLSFIGLGNTELLYTEGAVLLGMVYNFLPFMILQIQTSLSKMDHSLLEASADLGANPAMAFLRVTLPLSLPGVINGITLVFLPAVSSFFIPKLLGGGQYFLIGNMIENQFITVGEWNFGSAISMVMAVIMMLLMMAVRKAETRNQGGRRHKTMNKKKRPFGKVLMILTLAFFYLPIIYMIIFSFNDGKSLTNFTGFSLQMVPSYAGIQGHDVCTLYHLQHCNPGYLYFHCSRYHCCHWT